MTTTTVVETEPKLTDISDVISAAAEVGIKVRQVKRPFAGKQIFGMNISYGNHKNGGYVAMYPGEGSEIEVLGTDPDLQQLVLKVKEPPRHFFFSAYHRSVWSQGNDRKETLSEARARFKDLGDTVVGQYKNGNWKIRSTTPAETRRFLVGYDDGHLFISQLKTNPTTVAGAHRSLRPEEVTGVEGEDWFRQGEWFFIRTSPLATGAINKSFEKNGTFHREYDWATDRYKNVGPQGQNYQLPGNTGNAHRASIGFTTDKGKFYVKGTINHPTHPDLSLPDGWWRAVKNEEKELPAHIPFVD